MSIELKIRKTQEGTEMFDPFNGAWYLMQAEQDEGKNQGLYLDTNESKKRK